MCIEGNDSYYTQKTYNSGSQRYYGQNRDNRNRKTRSEKPNIILIITDDQDEMLGKYSEFDLYLDL